MISAIFLYAYTYVHTHKSKQKQTISYTHTQTYEQANTGLQALKHTDGDTIQNQNTGKLTYIHTCTGNHTQTDYLQTHTPIHRHTHKELHRQAHPQTHRGGRQRRSPPGPHHPLPPIPQHQLRPPAPSSRSGASGITRALSVRRRNENARPRERAASGQPSAAPPASLVAAEYKLESQKLLQEAGRSL